ncbi:hypothetical protein GCM10009078_26300 [Cupriavidus gilardii]
MHQVLEIQHDALLLRNGGDANGVKNGDKNGDKNGGKAAAQTAVDHGAGAREALRLGGLPPA